MLDGLQVVMSYLGVMLLNSAILCRTRVKIIYIMYCDINATKLTVTNLNSLWRKKKKSIIL